MAEVVESREVERFVLADDVDVAVDRTRGD